jgi:hypothetical protein
VSLTRDIIPSNRTCESAFIPDEYCPCFNETPLDPQAQLSHTLAQQVVDEVNEKLQHVSHLCVVPLQLHAVIDAQQLHTSNGILQEVEHNYGHLNENNTQVLMYRVSLSVQPPSNAIFQAVVRRSVDNTFRVIGDIDRNNRYGSTSLCLGDKGSLRKLCFCKECLTKTCD